MSYDKLLVVDLESTGNQPEDEIVEVAAILVDRKFNEVRVVTRIVVPTEAGFARILANPIVLAMHTESGLLAELYAARDAGVAPQDLAGIEDELLSWYNPTENIVISGSGVSNFDVPMLRRYMPKLSERFPYYSMDIGFLRRWFNWSTGKHLSPANKSKTHRGLDDCRCHIEEGRAFTELFKLAVAAGLVDEVQTNAVAALAA